jgi:MPBQ/MSBQ methyltransferase
MSSIVKNFLNPVKVIKAICFHKKQKKYTRSGSDLELMFYSRIFKSDMLHLGYFEDTEIEQEDISINDIEKAQVRYAENIVNKITNSNELILDVGCGMGGLAAMLMQQGYNVEVLTPNNNQIEYIKEKYPNLPYYNVKYEDLNTDKKYGTVITSESLQYINLDRAFLKTEDILSSGGQWIISDFFSIGNNIKKKSRLKWDEFSNKIKEHKLEIIYQQDITTNILPVYKFLNLYVTRFGYPLIDYLENKLLVKKAWLFYLTSDFRASLRRKVLKETASIDPGKFITEYTYQFIVLKKN